MLCSILLVLFIPFELSILSFEHPWGRGFPNPYTTIHFGLRDALLFLTGIVLFIQNRTEHKVHFHGHKHIYLLFLFFLACTLLSFFLSPHHEPLFFFLLSIKLCELLLFYKIICAKNVDEVQLLKVFIYALSVQALLGMVQVFLQKSMGLYFLGEPHLSGSIAHLAHFTVDGLPLIRAYGTFPHPNVLGGFLVFGILASLLVRSSFKYERALLLSAQFLGLLVTFSRSAELALTLALILILFWNLKLLKQSKNKIIPLALFFLFIIEFVGLMMLRGPHIFQDASFLDRWEGLVKAWEFFKAYPFGLGFSSFTLFLDEIGNTPLMPWEYQPVHNIYLLVLAELGIPGLLTIMIGLLVVFRTLHELGRKFLTPLQQFKKRLFLCIILSLMLIGFLDHYLISLEQGRYLSVIAVAFLSKFCNQPIHVQTLKKEENLSKILAGLE